MDLTDRIKFVPFLTHWLKKALIGIIATQKEFSLLNHVETVQDGNPNTGHQLRTAPIMTRGALLAAGLTGPESQYGLLGQTLSVSDG